MTVMARGLGVYCEIEFFSTARGYTHNGLQKWLSEQCRKTIHMVKIRKDYMSSVVGERYPSGPNPT